jgi:hypothetical protein
MDKTDLYRLWAPQGESWSPWVKPVPFAHFDENAPSEMAAPREDVSWSWLPNPSSQTALILDLPGGESVLVGVSLIEQGYRPVPIFASCPPNPAATMETIARPAVPTGEIVASLAAQGPKLFRIRTLVGLIPAFLVDARRGARGLMVHGDIFDNRSALFESDFPSARTLKERGISKCLVVRDPAFPLADDLRYSLLPWARAGISIELADLKGIRTEFPLPPHGFFSETVHRISLMFALKRSLSGGFGRFVPESAGG